MVFHPAIRTIGPFRGAISSGDRSPRVWHSPPRPRSWPRAESDGNPPPTRAVKTSSHASARWTSPSRCRPTRTTRRSTPTSSRSRAHSSSTTGSSTSGSASLKDFGKKYGVEVKYETFYNMEQAIQKFQTGEVDYDVFFPTIDYIPKLVAAKLIQPLNHDYLPNINEPVARDAGSVLRPGVAVHASVHDLHHRHGVADRHRSDGGRGRRVDVQPVRDLLERGLRGEGRDLRRLPRGPLARDVPRPRRPDEPRRERRRR